MPVSCAGLFAIELRNRHTRFIYKSCQILYPHEELNLDLSRRRAALCPLSYGDYTPNFLVIVSIKVSSCLSSLRKPVR